MELNKEKVFLFRQMVKKYTKVNGKKIDQMVKEFFIKQTKCFIREVLLMAYQKEGVNNMKKME